MSIAIQARGLEKSFRKVSVLRGVDLDVADGERRAILGPNGAGKTTLFNVISGDLPVSAGSVELFGQDVTRMPARKRARLGLARTYQQSRLFLGLSVEDSIYLAILGVRRGHLRPVGCRSWTVCGPGVSSFRAGRRTADRSRLPKCEAITPGSVGGRVPRVLQRRYGSA